MVNAGHAMAERPQPRLLLDRCRATRCRSTGDHGARHRPGDRSGSISRGCSIPSSRPSPTAWEWALRFPARPSKLTADGSPSTARPDRARRSGSRCPCRRNRWVHDQAILAGHHAGTGRFRRARWSSSSMTTQPCASRSTACSARSGSRPGCTASPAELLQATLPPVAGLPRPRRAAARASAASISRPSSRGRASTCRSSS